jgi:hypothetical protein
LVLAAHELAVEQTAQPPDHDGVPGVRQTALELRGSNRAVSQSRQDRDHPIFGEQLQRAQSQLFAIGGHGK